MAIRIFNVHLHCPGMTDRRLPDSYSSFSKFIMQLKYISVKAYPNPCPGVSLASFAQINSRLVTIYAGKIIRSPIGFIKAKYVFVKMPAHSHVFYRKYGLYVFNSN